MKVVSDVVSGAGGFCSYGRSGCSPHASLFHDTLKLLGNSEAKEIFPPLNRFCHSSEKSGIGLILTVYNTRDWGDEKVSGTLSVLSNGLQGLLNEKECAYDGTKG